MGAMGRVVVKADVTPTERRILQLMADGYSQKEIAVMRNKAHATIRRQVLNLKDRMRVQSCAHAVAEGLRLGIIK